MASNSTSNNHHFHQYLHHHRRRRSSLRRHPAYVSDTPDPNSTPPADSSPVIPARLHHAHRPRRSTALDSILNHSNDTNPHLEGDSTSNLRSRPNSPPHFVAPPPTGPTLGNAPRLAMPPPPAPNRSRLSIVDLTAPGQNYDSGTSSTPNDTGDLEIMPETRASRKRRSSVHSVSSLFEESAGTSQNTKRRRVSADKPKPVRQDGTETTDDEKHEDGEAGADDMETAMRKQQEDQVKAQAANPDKPQNLTNIQCCVCLDRISNLTATSCGHVFCHECLVRALMASETRPTRRGEVRKSNCPMCRKPLSRTKPTDVVPLLLLKKGLSTQPTRKSKTKAP